MIVDRLPGNDAAVEILDAEPSEPAQNHSRNRQGCAIGYAKRPARGRFGYRHEVKPRRATNVALPLRGQVNDIVPVWAADSNNSNNDKALRGKYL